MKKKWGVFVLVLLLIGIGIWFAKSHFFKVEKEPFLTVYGNVDIREVNLGFRVFGKVKALYYEEGDRVQAGDLLAELDPIPYEEEIAKAKAQEKGALIAYRNAEKQFQRRKEAIASAAISEENFDNAETAMEETQAAIEAALAALASANTACEDTRLLAPLTGTLLSRIQEPGSVLNPGQPVYTLALDSPIWVRAYVSEPDLGKIYPGMEATVLTDSATYYKGQIGFISPVAEFTPKNVQTTDLRTELVYRIRVVISSPDRYLRQGMPVTVLLKATP